MSGDNNKGRDNQAPLSDHVPKHPPTTPAIVPPTLPRAHHVKRMKRVKKT